MRSAIILFKDEEAGALTQHDDGSFSFSYSSLWLSDSDKPAISLTLPKSKTEFCAEHLFPFFFNMIPEGTNKNVICRKKRIEQDDYFSLLMEVAKDDTIGAVRVIKQ